MNKKNYLSHQLALQINKIPSTYETNLYFANNMQFAFYIERLLHFCTAAEKFPSCYERAVLRRLYISNYTSHFPVEIYGIQVVDYNALT